MGLDRFWTPDNVVVAGRSDAVLVPSPVSTPNQDSPISDNKTPLLGVDVWSTPTT
jgi:superoxide dismutase